jgi:hypothetical protein
MEAKWTREMQHLQRTPSLGRACAWCGVVKQPSAAPSSPTANGATDLLARSRDRLIFVVRPFFMASELCKNKFRMA